MARKIRVGIAGFDHFFASLGAAQEIEQDPDAELVVVAHHDADRIRPLAERNGARWTTNYAEVVDADVDLLITGCPTSQNADLVVAAAERGRHILSVKPFATNLREADRIVAAVKRAGVRFASFDASWRLNPLYQVTKRWLVAGELGQPLSAFCLLRSSLPAFVWFGDPFEAGRSWWLDPKQSPGGGWIDHGIYYVDALRWLLGSEVKRVSGEVARLKHTDEALEDFGVGTFVFENGSVVTIEDTWHVEGAGMLLAFHLVGSGGEVLAETTLHGTPRPSMRTSVRRSLFGATERGWETVELPPSGPQLTAHMLAVLRGEEQPVADEDDSRATLAVCLAFYEAARELRSISL